MAPGRNDRCPCDSGKKVKQCCGQEVAAQIASEKARLATNVARAANQAGPSSAAGGQQRAGRVGAPPEMTELELQEQEAVNELLSGEPQLTFTKQALLGDGNSAMVFQGEADKKKMQRFKLGNVLETKEDIQAVNLLNAAEKGNLSEVRRLLHEGVPVSVFCWMRLC